LQKDRIAEVFKALAHPSRIRILQILEEKGEKCVRELEGLVKIKQSNLSQHLRILKEIAKKYEGKIKVGKLNVDENPATAGKYSIMGIPTLLFFNGGKVVDRVVGVVPKRTIEDKINRYITKPALLACYRQIKYTLRGLFQTLPYIFGNKSSTTFLHTQRWWQLQIFSFSSCKQDPLPYQIA